MRHKMLAGFVALMVVALSACGPSEADVQTAVAGTSAAEGGTATAEARAELSTQRAAAASATAARAAVATEAAATEQAAAEEATRAAEQLQVELEATEQAAAMYEVVEELHADGYLSTTEGTYYSLPDYDRSWAQINWYQWTQTGFAPTDFVIQADAAWDTASMTANWDRSGCGFVFREDGVSNHYLAYLGLDGYVDFIRNVNDQGAFLGRSYYGSVGKPSGNAQIMLVVEGYTFVFFVNGERVRTQTDQGLATGNLALTMLSGINTGFGTRCTMTDIGLWVIE
jgi:hypothetical protein